MGRARRMYGMLNPRLLSSGWPSRLGRVAVGFMAATVLDAADPYATVIEPFLAQHCISCHNPQKAKADLDLQRYGSAADVASHFRDWQNIATFIRTGEMPPETVKAQPAQAEREAVLAAIDGILVQKAAADAGDPGPVLPRRLSCTEFDCAIRDLTGFDLRPARSFPSDPSAGEGFDNAGEALAMTPNLFKKLLGAASEVANHLYLTPQGVAFAPVSMASAANRREQTERDLVAFYRRHDPDLRQYLLAAWRFRHRPQTSAGQGVEAWAKGHGLSGTYLAQLFQTLEEEAVPGPRLSPLGRLWKELSVPTGDQQKDDKLLAPLLKAIADFRSAFAPAVNVINAGGGNWPIGHLAKRMQVAEQRGTFDRTQLRNAIALPEFSVPAPKKGAPAGAAELPPVTIRIEAVPGVGRDPLVILHGLRLVPGKPAKGAKPPPAQPISLAAALLQHDPEQHARLGFGRHPAGKTLPAESLALRGATELTIRVPPAALAVGVKLELQVGMDADSGCALVHLAAGKIKMSELLIEPKSRAEAALVASGDRLCAVFPSCFVSIDGNRGLSAGFHLVEGAFRDDRVLVALVLDTQQRAELDRLWRNHDFVTAEAEQLLRGLVWFERAERNTIKDKRFDKVRAEDPALVEEPLFSTFEKDYVAKIGAGGAKATTAFFAMVRQGIALRRQLEGEAEKKGLEQMLALAERAWRRSLSTAERQRLQELYQLQRSEQQGVEQALRGVLMAILTAPDFLYVNAAVPDGSGAQSLGGPALASRLSFFLWSSIPDAELTSAAANADLLSDAGLRRQVQRMLGDRRAEIFAREFFGQWLRYRDFVDRNSISAEAFPTYTESLRRAMSEEPTRLASWLIREDKPITELIFGDSTFVNKELAGHYGGAIAQAWAATASTDTEWKQVSGLHAAGRGGMFGMGVILAKNAVGDRTSPVKRGFWTASHLLGQHFPPPPANVPELPAREKDAKATVRELLAAHVENPDCAACHVRFDGLGLAQEGFDAIGRSRSKDLAGRAIDDRADLPGGGSARGVAGLIEYVRSERQQEFTATLCRKLLGYALGRAVQLSDRPLLDRMQKELEQGGFRLSAAITTVVLSPQFRQLRGRDTLASSP